MGQLRIYTQAVAKAALQAYIGKTDLKNIPILHQEVTVRYLLGHLLASGNQEVRVSEWVEIQERRPRRNISQA